MVEKISRKELKNRAWLAGMLEGDGWFSFSTVATHSGRLKGNRMEIGVSNKDPRIIQRVSQIWFEWGIKFSYTWAKNHNNNLVIRTVGYGNCEKILNKVFDCLSAKKDQATAMLAFMAAKKKLPRYFHKDPELLSKFIMASEQLKTYLKACHNRQFNLQRLKRTASKPLVLEDDIV